MHQLYLPATFNTHTSNKVNNAKHACQYSILRRVAQCDST